MNDDEQEAERARIRAAFPLCVAVADEYRAAFGNGVVIRYMSEGGRELGNRAPEGKVFIVKLDDTPPEIEGPAKKKERKRWRKR